MGCQVRVKPIKLTTVMNDKKAESTKSYETIKLGIDAHSKWYYVARQLDGATPQPVQKMELDGLLHFVAKQQKLNPLSPPCIPPNSALHGLSARSKFLAVSTKMATLSARVAASFSKPASIHSSEKTPRF